MANSRKSKKAPNGHGSIRKKFVRGIPHWEGRYTDPITHKQLSVYGDTQRECSDKLKQVIADMTTGKYVTPQKMTIAEWMDKWLESRKGIEDSTKDGPYEQAIRLHIKPYLGKIKLQDLNVDHCQDFVDYLTKKTYRGKPLSAKTIANYAGVLSSALEAATKRHLINSNCAYKLDLPKHQKPRIKVMDSDTQDAFEIAIEDSPYRNIYMFCLHTGARISEVLGIQWENVDLDTGEIGIVGQLGRKRGKQKERKLKSTTKSHRVRTIVVPEFVIDILKDEKLKQDAWERAAGEYWRNDDGLVFTRSDGSPMPHTTVYNAYKRIVKEIGKPNLALHDLRHTYATEEIGDSETDLKTISDNLGHSSVSFTLDIYADATTERKRAAAARRQAAREQRKSGS